MPPILASTASLQVTLPAAKVTYLGWEPAQVSVCLQLAVAILGGQEFRSDPEWPVGPCGLSVRQMVP